MMRMIPPIGTWAFLIALYYAIVGAMGAELIGNLSSFMFDDYIAFYDKHLAERMPGWTHPAILVIGGALLVIMIPGLLNVTRFVAVFIIALALVRLGFNALGSDLAPPPTSALILTAIFAAGWLLVLSALGDRGLWAWLKNRGNADG
jgi:hypothetical protein